MPSVSKQQQKFFGLVRALQKGDVSPSSVSKKARDAAKSIKKSDVKKYAATKHKGLPRKVKGETRVKSLIKKMVREVLDEIQLDEKCQPGYMTHPTRKTKKMFGKTYRNCVKKENTAPNHDGKAAPFGSGYKKAKNLSKILKNLNEKLSKSQIKKMRDKFNKTGKLPPHLMKLAKLMDKHTEVRNIVVPGLEWMSKLGEGKLNEVKNPLWDKSNAQSALNQIKKGLKNAVPYVDDLDLGAVSRRDDYPSFVGKISVDNKKDWPNGYIHNSRFALVHIDADGTIDTVRMNGYRMGKDANGKKVPILRKSKNRTIKQIIDRLGRYFTVIRTKHPGSD